MVRATGKTVPRVIQSPLSISPLPKRFVLEYFALREELGQARRKLAELENRLSEEEVMVVKDITKEEAKKEIRQLFSKGQTLYYSDIVKELGLDLELVVEVCNELESEGVVGVDADI